MKALAFICEKFKETRSIMHKVKATGNDLIRNSQKSTLEVLADKMRHLLYIAK